jgi:hypothetical protein
VPICPDCGCAFLIQQPDPKIFICASCIKLGVRYRLVREKACANCGEVLELLPNGLCRSCARKLADKGVK